MASARFLLIVAAGLGGLALTVVAVTRWAPDAAAALPAREAVLRRAPEDAEALGYRLTDTPGLQMSAGPRALSADSDLSSMVGAVREPWRRRELLRQAPPLRLGVRYRNAVGPAGAPGVLLLEYDRDARLTAASFGLDGTLPPGLARVQTRSFADRLAETLIGAPPQTSEIREGGGGLELAYRAGDDRPGAYVYLGAGPGWLGQRQPYPSVTVSEYRGLMRDPWVTMPIFALVAGGMFAMAVLLWRLTRRRAGFGRAPALALLLAVGISPVFGNLSGAAALIAAFLLLCLLAHLGVLLLWTTAEAELREVRPGSVDHWDRLTGWMPLAATGRNLLLGLALGCAFAALISASGELASLFGGGYGLLLVILPDYWMLPTPLSWGLSLAAATGFAVGFGGRVAGRSGAIVGATASAVAWAQAAPLTPLGWCWAFGLVAALFAGWIAWHHGLLTLATATVTAFSLPTALVAWSAFPLLLPTALIASLPALLLPAGLLLAGLAPRHGDPASIAPDYVSQLEREARLEAEVRLLRTFQLSLLPPRSFAPPDGVEIAWRMIPADVVGGDFLDLERDDAGRLWLAIADVAGHGISCSVLTAFTKAAVAQHAVAELGPAEAMARIRRLFSKLHTTRTMVTLQLAVWDPARRELSVASAGHPPLLLWNGRQVREVGASAPPLGVALPGEEREECLSCPDEAVIVGYTDGVVEAISPRGEPFSYQRWPDLLPAIARRPAFAVLDALLAAVADFRQSQAAVDDITAVVIKLRRPPAEASD